MSSFHIVCQIPKFCIQILIHIWQQIRGKLPADPTKNCPKIKLKSLRSITLIDSRHYLQCASYELKGRKLGRLAFTAPLHTHRLAVAPPAPTTPPDLSAAAVGFPREQLGPQQLWGGGWCRDTAAIMRTLLPFAPQHLWKKPSRFFYFNYRKVKRNCAKQWNMKISYVKPC